MPDEHSARTSTDSREITIGHATLLIDYAHEDFRITYRMDGQESDITRLIVIAKEHDLVEDEDEEDCILDDERAEIILSFDFPEDATLEEREDYYEKRMEAGLAWQR